MGKKVSIPQSYSSKLKDPRWQKKRLQILQRDEFKCKSCGNDESTLHVHHMVYMVDNPWESADIDLVTLCENCHETYHTLSALGIDFSVVYSVMQIWHKHERDSIKQFMRKRKGKPLKKRHELCHLKV
jgi:hypothetical protein